MNNIQNVKFRNFSKPYAEGSLEHLIMIAASYIAKVIGIAVFFSQILIDKLHYGPSIISIFTAFIIPYFIIDLKKYKFFIFEKSILSDHRKQMNKIYELKKNALEQGLPYDSYIQRLDVLKRNIINLRKNSVMLASNFITGLLGIFLGFLTYNLALFFSGLN